MQNNIAVKLKDITKTFGKKVIANKDVTLDIKKGEILSLLGENGSLRQDHTDEYACRYLLS